MAFGSFIFESDALPWSPCNISSCVCSKPCLSGPAAELVAWNGNLICVGHNIAYMTVGVKISAF